MIAHGFIRSGPAYLVSEPEAFGPFTGSFITDRELIQDKIVATFQGSDVWTYMRSSKKHLDRRMGYKLIYNHYLGPSNIDHMASGSEKKIAQ